MRRSARGRHGGRPASLSPARAAHARQLYDAGEHTVVEIAGLTRGPDGWGRLQVIDEWTGRGERLR